MKSKHIALSIIFSSVLLLMPLQVLAEGAKATVEGQIDKILTKMKDPAFKELSKDAKLAKFVKSSMKYLIIKNYPSVHSAGNGKNSNRNNKRNLSIFSVSFWKMFMRTAFWLTPMKKSNLAKKPNSRRAGWKLKVTLLRWITKKFRCFTG